MTRSQHSSPPPTHAAPSPSHKSPKTSLSACFYYQKINNKIQEWVRHRRPRTTPQIATARAGLVTGTGQISPCGNQSVLIFRLGAPSPEPLHRSMWWTRQATNTPLSTTNTIVDISNFDSKNIFLKTLSLYAQRRDYVFRFGIGVCFEFGFRGGAK